MPLRTLSGMFAVLPPTPTEQSNSNPRLSACLRKRHPEYCALLACLIEGRCGLLAAVLPLLCGRRHGRISA